MLLDRAIPVHVTVLYIVTVLNMIVLFHVSLVAGDVLVEDLKNETIDIFQDYPADFGPDFPEDGLKGFLYYVTPHNGCAEIPPPPGNLSSRIWIALISRNKSCNFDIKVINAQKAGYQGVIVFNNEGDDAVFPMAAGKLGYKVHIPSALVGYTDGLCLQNYQSNRFTVTVDNQIPFNFDKYLIPFAVVVGTCFILMIIFMIGKWCRDIHKKRKSRLSKTNLKKIPVKKFKKGDEYDVCAICLDDYEEGEKLRVLPCSHAYHCKCIDPWLTKQKRTCPVCKRRVMPRSSQDSDTDSDEDNGNNENTERTPLLGGNNGNSDPNRRSTFDNSGLPQLADPELITVVVRQSRDVDSDSSESEEGAVGRLPWTKCISKSPKELQEMGNSNEAYAKASDSEDIEDDSSTPEPLDVSDPDVVVVMDQGTKQDQSHVI